MSRIAEELNLKAIERGVAGPYTSWWHLFGWNTMRDFIYSFRVASKLMIEVLTDGRMKEI
jgi:hypothetical protein